MIAWLLRYLPEHPGPRTYKWFRMHYIRKLMEHAIDIQMSFLKFDVINPIGKPVTDLRLIGFGRGIWVDGKNVYAGYLSKKQIKRLTHKFIGRSMPTLSYPRG